MMIFLAFLSGLMLGAALGLLVGSMLAAGRQADDIVEDDTRTITRH